MKKLDMVLHFSSSKIKKLKPFYFAVYQDLDDKKYPFSFALKSFDDRDIHEGDIHSLIRPEDKLNFFPKGINLREIVYQLREYMGVELFDYDTIKSPVAIGAFEGGGEVTYMQLKVGGRAPKYFKEGGGLVLTHDDSEKWGSHANEIQAKDLLKTETYGFTNYYLDNIHQADYEHVVEFPLRQHLLANKLIKIFKDPEGFFDYRY